MCGGVNRGHLRGFISLYRLFLEEGEIMHKICTFLNGGRHDDKKQHMSMRMFEKLAWISKSTV